MGVAYEFLNGEKVIGWGFNEPSLVRPYAKVLGRCGTIDQAYFATADGFKPIPVVPFEFFRDDRSVIRGTVVNEYKEALFLWCAEMFNVDRADFRTEKRNESIDLNQPVPVGA